MMTPVLELRNLSISYSDGDARTQVVQDVSLSVAPGVRSTSMVRT